MNEKIIQTLKDILGYTSFRPLQAEIIQAIMQQKDCLAILPTGTGKSLCYQLPGILLDGIVVVVSPLLSLMEDQVNSLIALKKYPAVAINSLLSQEEKQ